jgi:ribosomal protein S18 acetylase RimI-like enzyme
MGIIKNKYIFHSDKGEQGRNVNDRFLAVVTTSKEFKSFFYVPWVVYKNDPHWVPPFWMEYSDFFRKDNPFWKHAECRLFLVSQKNKVIGRIAAFIDYEFCKHIGKKVGFFGFFECIQDFSGVHLLFDRAEKWLASKGMSTMWGPINGRVDVGCGFLFQGFQSTPYLLSSYSKRYYLDFVEKLAMNKVRDQYLYYIDLTQPLSYKLKQGAQQCKKSGVKIRPFNRLHTTKELNWWIDFFMETFEDHWGYVPVSAEEVKLRFGIKQLQWFVDSRLFLIAELDNSPVAYLWSTPDYNQVFQRMNGRLTPNQILRFLWLKKHIKRGKLHLIGIRKKFRNQQIGSYLNYEVLKEMKQRGYIGAEVGWIDEKNTAAHATISKTGATLYKKFRVVEKKIST